MSCGLPGLWTCPHHGASRSPSSADLFTGLFDDADALPDEQQPENAGDLTGEQGAEESADELP